MKYIKILIPNLTKRMSSLSSYQFDTLNVTAPKEFVYQVELNNPTKKNAVSEQMWIDIKNCFDRIKTDMDCRSVVLSGAGDFFCAGIDLTIFGKMMGEMETDDVGRRAFYVRRKIVQYQNSLASVERCLKPVIAAVDGGCLGAGLNLICYADIRLASRSAWFQLREIQLGLAADIGSLQLLSRIMSSESTVRQLVYTGRKFSAEEAVRYGLLSDPIADDRDQLIAAALDLAHTIAGMSPVAVQASKDAMLYSRDHPNVRDGLEKQADCNQAYLQSEDLIKAVMGVMQKQKPQFSKL